jgi:hypothetical protein
VVIGVNAFATWPEKFGELVGLLRRESLVTLPALGRFRGQPLSRQLIGLASDRGVLLAAELVAAGADSLEIIGGADHRQRYAGRPVARYHRPRGAGLVGGAEAAAGRREFEQHVVHICALLFYLLERAAPRRRQATRQQ